MPSEPESAEQAKKALRKAMLARRAASPEAERLADSAAVCALLSHRGDISAPSGAVAVYLAVRGEADVSAFAAELMGRGIPVAAPRWNGATYELAALEGLDARFLRAGPMGVPEPAEPRIVPADAVACWLVPGLAFTPDGRRLGYGGGWYDRLLAGARRGAIKLGIARPFQMVAEIPEGPHDVRMDDVVCAGGSRVSAVNAP